jgi:hypothetical protein
MAIRQKEVAIFKPISKRLFTCVGAPQSRIFEAEPVVSILTDYPRHNMSISTRRDLPLDGSAPAITSAL